MTEIQSLLERINRLERENELLLRVNMTMAGSTTQMKKTTEYCKFILDQLNMEETVSRWCAKHDRLRPSKPQRN